MSDQIALDEHGEPLLDQFSADGFVDCTFRIAELSSDAKTHTLSLTASHRGLRVGFRAAVVRGLQAGFDADMELIPAHVYRRAVRFERTGPESDALLMALAELYGVNDRPGRMAEVTSFTGIVLHQGDVDLEVEPIKIKLFGGDGEPFEEEAYFESFFNLDFRAGYVYWNEKDTSYRESLLRGLAAVNG